MRNDLEGKEKSPKIGSIDKEYGLTKFNSNDIHYLRREKGRPLGFVLVGIVRVFFLGAAVMKWALFLLLFFISHGIGAASNQSPDPLSRAHHVRVKSVQMTLCRQGVIAPVYHKF